LTFAIGARHIQLLQISLASDDPIANQDQALDALLRASLIGNTAAVEALLDKGLNVNAKDRNGWTPLLEAVFGGHTDTVRVLLNRGADVNKPDQAGWTPLMEAASKGHTEIIKILLKYGAVVNVRIRKSWTALSIASKRNREISRLLKGITP
jgi:ankyrin repeat protein